VNKREAMLSLLDASTTHPYVPAAFFLHFDPSRHRGQRAVDVHLEYFRHTHMDFVKIQYEHAFPRRPGIVHPADWASMPRYGIDFYQDPLGVVEGLVREARREALVLVTLYSPFMCAGQTVGPQTITRHLVEDPEATVRGMEAITDSVLIFVRECVRLGVDGFYASTQGAEAHRFPKRSTFERYVKPYDLAVMREIDRSCAFNILHVCDYHGGYHDLEPFLDYPGHVVNCSLELGTGRITPAQASEFFGRPYMGGMDRHGALASGTQDQIRRAAEEVLRQAPDRFILGADCTVPSDIDWDNLRTAIDTAHRYRAGGGA
jgi:uroporphyrinogen decarboxylase